MREKVGDNSGPFKEKVARGNPSPNVNRSLWVKDIEDGSKAVGSFFTAENYADPVLAFNWDGVTSADIRIRFSDLGLKGNVRVSDLCRQKELGVFSGESSADVPFHGVVLVRMWEVR